MFRLACSHFDSIAVPEVKCISSGVAVGYGGQLITARSKDGVDLIVGSERNDQRLTHDRGSV